LHTSIVPKHPISGQVDHNATDLPSQYPAHILKRDERSTFSEWSEIVGDRDHHFTMDFAPIRRSEQTENPCEAQPKHRAKFSPEDDARLRSVIRLYGVSNWNLVADHIPGKTARQCRERWMYYLSPELNTCPWTPAEDALLIEKYTIFGSRWVQIAKFFTNRTDAMVKNRFLMLQRRKKGWRRRTALAHSASPMPITGAFVRSRCAP
jgi:hypothetical protein